MDNFNLKKFLTENKSFENLNPIISKENLSEGDIRAKIREMIIAELSEEKDLEEAKKKKDEEVEDIETTDTSIEDIPTADEMPAEEAPTTDSGLENIAANLEGTESEVMDHLMSALKIAKGMNNEKLTTQIGNTLKFFVSEYIGGGE